MVAWTEAQKAGQGLMRRILARLTSFALTPPDLPAPAAPAPVAPTPSYPSMPSVDAIDTLHVLMVGYGDGALAGPARWLADQGARVSWLAPRLGVLEALAEAADTPQRAPNHVMLDIDALSRQARDLGGLLAGLRPEPGFARAITHVMVDIDALGGIVVAYDGLRVLRNRRPDLPVLVVSDELSCNDFSLERLPLCDASLRAPVAYGALEYALTESRDVNNPAWVARLNDLRSAS